MSATLLYLLKKYGFLKKHSLFINYVRSLVVYNYVNIYFYLWNEINSEILCLQYKNLSAILKVAPTQNLNMFS
jgi:uncharacterized membrane protein